LALQLVESTQVESKLAALLEGVTMFLFLVLVPVQLPTLWEAQRLLVLLFQAKRSERAEWLLQALGPLWREDLFLVQGLLVMLLPALLLQARLLQARLLRALLLLALLLLVLSLLVLSLLVLQAKWMLKATVTMLVLLCCSAGQVDFPLLESFLQELLYLPD